MWVTMRSKAGAMTVVLALCACGGGGSSQGPTTPLPTPAVTAGPLSDGTTRAVVQAALLAQQAAIVLVVPSGAPTLFARRRRPMALSPRAVPACSGGVSEVDTAGNAGTVHTVVSLYFDAACGSLRQTATFDRIFGIDTSSSTGTIVSYDGAGHVTAVQIVNDAFFASGGGFANRQSTDAVSASAPPFGHTTLFCAQTPATCTLAAVTDGSSFETGVLLDAPVPPTPPAQGASATVAFGGSIATAAPGTIGITQSGFTAPALGGSTPLATLAGSLTITPGNDGPTAFSLSLDSAGMHVAGSLSNGATTFALSDGTTATVNADGDGTIRYASGPSENVVDYRITG